MWLVRIGFAGSGESMPWAAPRRGRSADFYYWTPRTWLIDFVTFAEEVRLARAVTVGRSLDRHTFVARRAPRQGMAISLRWIDVRMIEDVAPGIMAMRSSSA